MDKQFGHNSEVAIRRAVPGDIPGILHCMQDAFAIYKSLYSPEAFQDTTLTSEKATERLATMSVFVAASEFNEVVGTLSCVRCATEEGHLRGMALRRTWQGTGVANRLLCAAEDHLKECGCRYVTLDTTEPLRRAIQFYRRHGYLATGKTRTYFGMTLFEYKKELMLPKQAEEGAGLELDGID